MRKTRKKAISILVALTFLLGLVFAYAGPAAADTVWTEFTSGFKYVTTGEDKEAGTITVKAKKAWSESGSTESYITVTLPSGVTYKDEAGTGQVSTSDYVYVDPTVNQAVYVHESSTSMLRLRVAGTLAQDRYINFTFSTGNARLKVDSSVSGDINATVEVMGVSGNEIKFLETGTVTIARVKTDAVTVTADTPASIQPGIGVDGAKITIQEGAPGAIPNGKKVYLEIVTSDVSFTSTPPDGTVFDGSVTDRVYLTWQASTVLPKKVDVSLDDKLVVPPSVTGDIKVKVFGESGSNVPETVLTVATIGTAAVSITDVKNNDGTLYAGYYDSQFVQKSDKKASFTLKATGGKIAANKVVVLELSAGKFDKDGPAFTATNEGGTSAVSDQGIKFYNDEKAAWFVTRDAYEKITISDIKVKVAGDAAAGDLVIKVSGTAGASGEVTVGKIAKPFSATAEAPQLTYPGLSQAAGDIVITEAAAGKIKAGELYLELPEGITFDGKPKVEVTAGNISASRDDANTTSNKLTIDVTSASGIASTIKISGIKYNVARAALEGDVNVKIYGQSGAGMWDGKTLAKVVNAKVVSAAKREAAFVIGSTSYKVNGEEKTMDVAPYIDAKSGRTYLPVRYVALALGVAEDNIFWDAQARTVTLLKGDRAVQMTIGSKALLINGITITMDAAPEIKDGRTMLPFRWVAQALGASVSWDEATKTVTMNIE